MQASLEIDTSAFDAAIERIERATDPSTAGPMRDGLIAASDMYHTAMRARFDAASARDGAWAEHAPSTIRRRGAGAPILIERGDLRESLERSGSDHVIDAEGDSVIEGTQNFTARFHQSGTLRMPARPILVEPDGQTLAEMTKPIASAIAQALL